jgi:hypothetical protein
LEGTIGIYRRWVWPKLEREIEQKNDRAENKIEMFLDGRES